MGDVGETTDVRDELRQYIGEEVALVVCADSLRVVGHGVMSLLEGGVKAVRVGNTTLNLDSWGATEVKTHDHAPDPPTTSFALVTGETVQLGWFDLLLGLHEE